MDLNEALRIYNYVIVFKGGDMTIQSPIISGPKYKLMKDAVGGMHQFDPELVDILPAISYCLHLPRFECDTLGLLTPSFHEAMGEIYHNIIVVPSLMCSQISKFYPTLIIYDDTCDDLEKEQLKKTSVEIECIPVSALTDNLLMSHWTRLYENSQLKEIGPILSLDKQCLLKGKQRLILPTLFFSRYQPDVSEIYKVIQTAIDDSEEIISMFWRQMVYYKTLARCPNLLSDVNVKMQNELRKTENSCPINVVITLPGVSNKQKEIRGGADVLSSVEVEVIQLLALHCAIAKHALIIELPIIPDSLYKLLHDIEIHQKEKPEERNNNVAVLRKLRKLGKQFSSLISDEQMKLIKSANQITVYSDFPIGLAIFDDDDISLHSYKKVTYHSLSPLINSLQFELPTIFEIDFTKKIKVLFAECVIDNQNNGFIRKCSKKLLDHLKSLYKNEGKIEVAYRETLSVASLMSFIRDNPDADVLYISAHGFYSPQRNMAGLSIGNEDWLAEEHFKVPPLVILSACHTTPRGAGCISVSDMLLRWGAVAVLGTYIPIKAQRNIYLMARFFSSISRALCHVSSCKDLLECWNDNTVTNIIMEYIAETPGFRKWMYGQNGDGTIRLNEFERRLTSRRWLAGNAYKTACEIIYEMLNEEGQSGRFANLLSRQDYFPEMSFYQWEGMPESIILQNTDIDNSIIK